MRSVILMAGLGCALVQGCVTINIYFPAAAAEQAPTRSSMRYGS
jgi:hypothetical protein